MQEAVFDVNEANDLRLYAIRLSEWIMQNLSRPIGRLMGTIVPTELESIGASINELIQLLLVGDKASRVPAKLLPLLKRAILTEKRAVSESQEKLRSSTVGKGVRDQIEHMIEPIDRFETQQWYKHTTPFRIPSLSSFLNMHAAYDVLPVELQTVATIYDEKFGYLHSPTDFFPRLRNCRIEAWLRNISLSVAFIDIDDFKPFNTKHTESIIDRDLFPVLMRALEAHVFAHGWAYRFGGDEYVLLLPNSTLHEASDFVNRLNGKIRMLKYIGIAETITISVGICSVGPDSAMTDRDVLESANKAKEYAKKIGGKNIMALFEENAGLRNKFKLRKFADILSSPTKRSKKDGPA